MVSPGLSETCVTSSSSFVFTKRIPALSAIFAMVAGPALSRNGSGVGELAEGRFDEGRFGG